MYDNGQCFYFAPDLHEQKILAVTCGCQINQDGTVSFDLNF